MFNGMATGADWMSAAAFIGLAGGLYLQGYSGRAFIMGWTGGYVLVALFLAPYLRKFGQFAIPDFLGARYGGHIPRFIGIVIALPAAGFFPALVLGIFWKRTTGVAASLGMIAGFATTFYYMVSTQVWLREIVFGVPRSAPVDGLWWEIQPIAADVFGVPVGFAVIVLLSLVTPPPSRETQRLVENVRYPNLKAA
jgi:Na+(H+)/acetate symporter ActP